MCENKNLMALYRYFKKPAVADVPDPFDSLLSRSVSPAAIKDANAAVKKCHQSTGKARGAYAKFTPENQADIARYAFLHGN